MLQWHWVGIMHWFVYMGFLLLSTAVLAAYFQLFEPSQQNLDYVLRFDAKLLAGSGVLVTTSSSSGWQRAPAVGPAGQVASNVSLAPADLMRGGNAAPQQTVNSDAVEAALQKGGKLTVWAWDQSLKL